MSPSMPARRRSAGGQRGAWARVLVPVGLVAAVTAGAAPPASAGVRGWIGAADRLQCRFDTGELGEISGMASSRQHEGVLWATNDSGNGPYLYALDTADCRIVATLELLDTPARDHEAVAVGRDASGRDVVWVADTGDNIGGWPYARIHKVVEPTVLRDAQVEVTTYRFTYPGGPVDAEAILAAPDREQLWVITKESGGGRVLALPSPMSDSRTPMRAEQVGTARSLVTDAAMSPDGSRFVVRDYLSAEVFQGEPPGRAQARFGLPIQPQGEAVAWTADGEGLLVASEGSADLLHVDVPATALGTDGGVASVLPRVAGFDIYPYVRAAAVGVAALLLVWLLARRARRRRR